MTPNDPSTGPTLDALLPEAVAEKAAAIGLAKTRRDPLSLITLAVLAGAFIALGAMMATLVSVGIGDLLPYGLGRLAIGMVFSLGLILVVVCGAELFTGDVLMTIAWAERRVALLPMLRVWVIVLVGNLIGGLGTALLVFLAGHVFAADGAVALAALKIASAKASLDPVSAFFLGLLCNVLVCLAVWASLAARSVADKILVIVPPVAAFVAAGFEHSVANFYYLGMGWLIRQFAPDGFWSASGIGPADFPQLTLANFIGSQAIVILGNLVGGAALVALVYWLAYLRPRRVGNKTLID
jgi:formate/nitrite transporter